MTSTPIQKYRPWQFLVLLVTLILLLVIQPMVQGFSSRSPVSSVLCSLVLVAAILSLCQGRWPTRLALILGVPAILGRWLAYMFASTGDDFITLTDHFVEILDDLPILCDAWKGFDVRRVVGQRRE